MSRISSAATFARYTLGGVRVLMGSVALFAPAVMVRNLGTDPDRQPAAGYALRLFGIRTVLIGAELLVAHPLHREHAVRLAPLIHASDTLAAINAGQRGHLPRRAAAIATAVSGLNTMLALIALPDSRARLADPDCARSAGTRP